MKILVLEWDISRFSGRMATMVKFADTFKEMGHDVHMVSNWFSSEIRDKEEMFFYHNIGALEKQDFSWNLERHYAVLPKRWRGYDFIFAPYVAYGHLSELPGGKPTVCWWISKQEGWSNETLEFWTNSQTTKNMIQHECGEFANMHVVVPPYDYGVFRDRAGGRADRHFDVAYLARAHFDKRLETFCNVAENLGLKAVLAVLCSSAVQRQYVKSLTDRYGGSVSFIINADKRAVADILGNTKIYFHPSKDESCSIAIYEALNAGCYPICRSTGAVKEQLDGVGVVYHRLQDPTPFIKDALSRMDWDVLSLMRRGEMFDKKRVVWDLNKRLKKIEERLTA